MSKITLMEIKEALKDRRFRAMLPSELDDKVTKFLANPGCACNLPLYRDILKKHKDILQKYFPGKEAADEAELVRNLAENHWTVINCSVDELEEKLKQLPPGRKQLAIARYNTDVTVVVNELDIVY